MEQCYALEAFSLSDFQKIPNLNAIKNLLEQVKSIFMTRITQVYN